MLEPYKPLTAWDATYVRWRRVDCDRWILTNTLIEVERHVGKNDQAYYEVYEWNEAGESGISRASLNTFDELQVAKEYGSKQA